MGAEIAIDGKDAWVHGGTPLCGCTVYAEELRGGAALILAALAAKGLTTIRGYSYVCRGYEDIGKDLIALGGMVIEDTGTEIYENIQLQEKNRI